MGVLNPEPTLIHLSDYWSVRVNLYKAEYLDSYIHGHYGVESPHIVLGRIMSKRISERPYHTNTLIDLVETMLQVCMMRDYNYVIVPIGNRFDVYADSKLNIKVTSVIFEKKI